MPQQDTSVRPEKGPASRMPEYRGAPLDPERGPGLGCFWLQMALLVILLVATPLSVVMVAPPWFSAALLIVLLVLLLFVGQTTIFLLRLVAVDRRSRRRPLRSDARPTVGQLEDRTRADVDTGERSADAHDISEPGGPAAASAADEDESRS